jgi:6-phosphofructokinase 1
VELLINGVGGHCVGMLKNEIVSMPIAEALALPRKSRDELLALHERLI